MGSKSFAEVLIAAEVDLGAKDLSGTTALMNAACNPDASIVEMLLAAKADVGDVALEGGTAVRCAAERGHASALQALIAAKADLEATAPGRYGRSCGDSGLTALMAAADLGETSAVEV